MSREKIIMRLEEFRLLRDLIYDYCGIFFHDDVQYLLERRLNTRLREKGISTFNQYYQLLRYDSDWKLELEQIVELLTTNETYFFREDYQLKAFTDEIIPELLQQRKDSKRLRIWSAGCSTGEEAYSLAILVKEMSSLEYWNVEIFGNDISRKVLGVARKGTYGKSSFRSTPEFFLKKYFKSTGNNYQVDEKIRSMVNFGHLNLLDDEMLQLIGAVDIVFCRNVLIYFDKPARIKVLKTFHDKLRPGGYLLLGHSESLVNITTDFELVYLKNDMVYRKPKVEGMGKAE